MQVGRRGGEKSKRYLDSTLKHVLEFVRELYCGEFVKCVSRVSWPASDDAVIGGQGAAPSN
eukprot:scaffold11601_cov125-Skeletonema_marinoi.AAC.7